MTSAVIAPSLSADVVEQADHLEMLVLESKSESASVSDLLHSMTIGGSAEVLDVDPRAHDGLSDPDDEETVIDPGGEVLEASGGAVLAEIEFREAACSGSYPFSINEYGVMKIRRGYQSSPYIFMLLLTQFGGTPKIGKKRVSTIDATRTFEDLALVAASEYLGWDDDHVIAYPFGFPRRLTPRGFEDAVNSLCQEIREGQGCRKRPNVADQKDATLDIVVVRRFPDRREGQLVAFGQCATGADWRSKLTDLQPETFCKLWMLDSLTVDPVRMFFVPHAIEERQWLHAAISAGVIFDRSRMAYYSTFPHEKRLRDEISDWCSAVLAAKVRS